MNGCRAAWLFDSRYGTSGKIHKLQIPNPKEHGTAALLITQYQMNTPPHFPKPPTPQFLIPVWKKKNARVAIPYYQTFKKISKHYNKEVKNELY